MLKSVHSEDILSGIIKDHLAKDDWNRVIVTGVSSSGKSTYLNKLFREDNIKVLHTPPFVMDDSHSRLVFRYQRGMDRWYPLDRFVYQGLEPICKTYGHDTIVIVFVRNQFRVPSSDRRPDYARQRDRYLELAKKLDESGVYSEVILLENP